MALPAYTHISYGLLTATAGFAFFRTRGNTIAESGAYGVMAMLMLHSWTSQVALMAGWQRFQHFGLALISIPAVRMIAMHRDILRSSGRDAKNFARDHWLPACTMAAGWMVLAALNVLRIGGERIATLPTHHPALITDSGNLFANAYGAAAPALIILNHAVFAAAWQPDAAVIVANLSAWLIIVLSTYALARRYTWPATAATVALLVICMPRVIQQSAALYSELLPAAAALCSLLAMYRAVEQPHAHDLVMLSAGVAFSVAGGRLAYLMPAILTGLSLVVMRRRHPARHWAPAFAAHKPALLLTLGAVLIFGQVVVVAINLAQEKVWIGAPALEEVAFNMDGLGGAVANAGRYAVQSVHFPDGFDHFWEQGLGFSLRAALEAAHRHTLGALLDGLGAATVFRLSWAVMDPWGWFGPVGGFLIFPALGYALWRAPRRLKSTALAMCAYFLAIALILAWRPQNVRLLTVFFVGSGFLIAFFLPPWRISRRGRLVLQVFSILLAGYTLMVS